MAKEWKNSNEWFDENVVENVEELLEVGKITNVILKDKLNLGITSPKSTIAYYAIIFNCICEAIIEQEDKWDDFCVNVADRIKVGYTTTSSEDDEKSGNFMVFIQHVYNTSTDESLDEEEEDTVVLCTQWNAANVKAQTEIIKNIAGTLVEFLAPVGKAVIDFLMALNPVYLIIKLITGIAGAIKDFFKSDEKEVEAEEPVSEEAASALGVTADAYNNMEQQKMNLFESKMNAVLKQIKDLGKVIMLSAAATMVTAKFFGVNPQNGQAAPQGTSMFAQTVATDGSTANESVEKENAPIDYNKVFEQMVKLLGEIRDKKIEVASEKKGGLFNLF